MKKTLTIFFYCFLFLGISFSQKMPLQGKLMASNGNLVNGQKDFILQLYDNGNLLWQETQNNIVVINGLYNLVLGANQTLPTDLFSTRTEAQLSIRVDGQLLDQIVLFAPLESDPTVPSNLKDGVSWTEVANKPTFDLSFTNGQLNLQGGGSVQIPVLSDDLEIGNSLTVGTANAQNTVGASQSAFNTQGIHNSVWQSFILPISGELTSLRATFGNSNNTNVQLKIYEGIGNGSQAIFDQMFSANNFSAAIVEQAFDIDGPQSINFEFGADYTFEIIGTSANLFFNLHNGNPYPDGTTNINGNTDLVFQVHMLQEGSYLMQVNENQIELGTTVVETIGRYYDKTGIVMPVGAIIPFGGPNPPVGWLVCDGITVSRDLYPDLFEAIGTAWGNGNGAATFHLPDLRGQFLRGVSENSDEDPDKDNRIAKYTGGSSGNSVGSYQNSELGSHNHNVDSQAGEYGLIRRSNFGESRTNEGSLDSDGSGTEPDIITVVGAIPHEGGLETRSKNAYVNYIIKY